MFNSETLNWIELKCLTACTELYNCVIVQNLSHYKNNELFAKSSYS